MNEQEQTAYPPTLSGNSRFNKLAQKFLLAITIAEVFLLLLGGILGEFHFRSGYMPFFLSKTDYGVLAFYIVAYLALIYTFFQFLVFLKFLVIFRNFYAKEFQRSSLVSAAITILNPVIAGSLIYRFGITINTFFSNPSFPGSRSTDILNGYLQFIEKMFPIFLVLQILLGILFFFFYRKDSTNILSQNISRTWIKAVVTFVAIAVLIPSVNQGLAYMERNKLAKEATEFRLSIDQSGGKVSTIKNFEPASISSDDGSNIKFEWKTLPSEVKVSSRLVVLYTDAVVLSQTRPGGQQSVDYIKSSCTVQKETTGQYYCYAYFSSRLPDYQNKKNYSFSIDTTISGNSVDRDESRKTALKKLAEELKKYKIQNGQYPCSPEYLPCEKGEPQISLNGKELPQFNWSRYKDPLTGEYYDYFTNTDYFDSKNQLPNFIAAAKLEASLQDNNPDWFCIDSNGVSQITTYMPDYPDRPYSCLNIYKSQAR